MAEEERKKRIGGIRDFKKTHLFNGYSTNHLRTDLRRTSRPLGGCCMAAAEA